MRVGPDLSFNSATIVYFDAFVARVNTAGTGLDYCGYIGGLDHDHPKGIAADKAGNAYVTGIAHSSEGSFPVAVGPDLTYNGYGGDVFVAKVDTTGKRLVYCGYIGGSAQEKGEAIAVDETGAAYVTGYTGSYPGTFPVKHGPGLTPGGLDDVFVAKVNPAGTDLVYCGYIAGGYRDVGLGIALGSSGNAYVAGWTESSEATFPVKVGPDITFNDPGPLPTSDAFVAKIALTLLEATGTPSPGSRIDFTVTATGDVGLPCQMASSLSTGPIAVDTRQIDLGYDGLLWTSVSGLVPDVFTNYRGYILHNGTSPASLSIPAIPATVGLKIHTAFVTLDPQAPSGIRSISNTFAFTITK